MELEGLLQTVKSFSDDIGIKFGLDKYAKTTYMCRQMANSSKIILTANKIIKELEQVGAHTYLGVSESNGRQHSNMKKNSEKNVYGE